MPSDTHAAPPSLGSRLHTLLRRALPVPALCVLIAAAAMSPSRASAAGGLPDIRGEWAGAACDEETLAECEAHPQAPQNFVIETEDFATGAVTGTGPGYTIVGSVSGHTFTVETLVGGTTSSSGTQTISADVRKLAGYFKAGSVNGATFSTRLTPSPTEVEAETIAKGKAHASATSVSCYVPLVAPGAAWECTATVADASGTVPAGTPTGTVSFAINAGVTGGFPYSSTCALARSSSGPTSFCTVLFVPTVEVPIGAPPPITARYSGDAHFSASSSAPESFVAHAEPPLAYAPCAASAASLLSPLAFSAAQKPLAQREVVVGDPRRAHRQKMLTRAAIGRRAIALLRPSRATSSTGVRVYGVPRALPAGTVIREASLGVGKPIVLPLKLREPAWLIWEDLAPLARYGHPSTVLVLSAHGGRVLARSAFISYPLIGSRPAPFVTHRRGKLLLFARGPGSSRPKRLSTAQMLLLARAKRQAAGARAARHGRRRALKSDTAHSSLIMLVDHTNKGGDETFENEEAAIGYTFAKHGVDVQGVTTVKGLSSAVEDATARGQSNVTIYLDGHGLNAASSPLPTVLLGPAESDGKTVTFPYGAVTSADLTAIVRAHPEVQFNFIIDSCYSGRFVDPLKAETNVGAVLTSSSGTQISQGAVSLVTYKPTPKGEAEQHELEAKERTEAAAESAPGSGGRGLVLPKGSEAKRPPEALTPSGEGLDLEADRSGAGISPFTTAVVAAVNQAFIGKDSSADMTTILADARTLEPSYDIAATLGKTSPSPEPSTESPTCKAPLPSEEADGGWFTKS